MNYLTEYAATQYYEAFFKIASSLHYAAKRDLHIHFNGEDTRIIIHDWSRYNNSKHTYKEYVTDTLNFTLEISEYFYIHCEVERSYKGEDFVPPERFELKNISLNRCKCTLYEYTIDAEEFDNYMVIATLMATDLKAVRNGY